MKKLIAEITLSESGAQQLKDLSVSAFGMRLNAGVKLIVTKRSALQEGTRHPKGRMLPMGAFSFSRSDDSGFVKIGRYTSMASGISVMGENHPTDWISTHPFQYEGRRFSILEQAQGFEYEKQPRVRPNMTATIGNDVWIGQDVLFSHGVHIGDGSVVAAGSVVTKDVPAYSIVGGVPAKTIRMRFPDQIIERLLAVKWWDFHYRHFNGLDVTQPEKFLDGFEERLDADNSIQPGFRQIKVSHLFS